MTSAIERIAADNRIDPAADRHNASHTPVPAANAPRARRIAWPDLPVEAEAAGAPILRDWNPLHQIKARLQVCVGEATLSVGELLAAKENQVLRLDRAIDQAVDLRIEGQVVARGQLVAVDDHFAVRITELPVALGLAPGN